MYKSAVGIGCTAVSTLQLVYVPNYPLGSRIRSLDKCIAEGKVVDHTSDVRGYSSEMLHICGHLLSSRVSLPRQNVQFLLSSSVIVRGELVAILV